MFFISNKLQDPLKLIQAKAQIDTIMQQLDPTWNPHQKLEFFKLCVSTILSQIGQITSPHCLTKYNIYSYMVGTYSTVEKQAKRMPDTTVETTYPVHNKLSYCNLTLISTYTTTTAGAQKQSMKSIPGDRLVQIHFFSL